jgi:solute carrier family 29 (equilibrative nucleoside transporter), member 1/2/3
MDRIRSMFAPKKVNEDEYEPLTDDAVTLEGSVYEDGTAFSWIEYSIFALIGVAMLWAWYAVAPRL